VIAQCADIVSDRALGEYWEKQFCRMAVNLGRTVIPLQLKREGSIAAYSLEGGRIKPRTMPDVIEGAGLAEAHEIKHKDPSAKGYIGLERYRWEALVKIRNSTGMPIRYTIHNYATVTGYSRKGEDRQRCKLHRENDISNWASATIEQLESGQISGTSSSYINGRSQDDVRMIYWPVEKFEPLSRVWKIG
jgi:hypothetical protein